MKTSSIVSSLFTASLAGAVAIERRQLFGIGSNSGAVSASVPGVSVCLDILGNGCATSTKTTSKTTSTAAAAVAATQTVTVQAGTTAAAVVNTSPAASVTASVGVSATVQAVGTGITVGTGTTVTPTVAVGVSTSTTVAVAATASASVAASSNTNTGSTSSYNAQADGTLNSNTGYYGTGCPSAYGANSWFPTLTTLTSRANPLVALSGYNYEITPNDVCTQMTFVIPASATGWKTCSFNVQVPSAYEFSKDSISYSGGGHFTWDGVANAIQPFSFNLPLIDWYGTAPGQSKFVASAECNIPAGVVTTVVSRVCSSDTNLKYAHTSDTCKVGVYLQTTAN